MYQYLHPLSRHDALPISLRAAGRRHRGHRGWRQWENCAAVRTSRCRSPGPATADHWTVIFSVSFQIPRILSVWNVAACDARQNGRTGERLDVVTARVETHASEQMPLT